MTPSPEPVYVVLETSQQGWWLTWGPTLVPLVVSLVALLGVLVGGWLQQRGQSKSEARAQRAALYAEFLGHVDADIFSLTQMAAYEVAAAGSTGATREKAVADVDSAHARHISAWTARIQVLSRIELVASEHVQRLCHNLNTALEQFSGNRAPGSLTDYLPVYAAQVAVGRAFRADLGVKGSLYVPMPATPEQPAARPGTPAQS